MNDKLREAVERVLGSMSNTATTIEYAAPVRAWFDELEAALADSATKPGMGVAEIIDAQNRLSADAPEGPLQEYGVIFAEICDSLHRTADQARKLRNKFDQAFVKIDAFNREVRDKGETT